MEDMQYDRRDEETNRQVHLLSDRIHIYKINTHKTIECCYWKLFSMPDASIIHQQPRLSTTEALIKANRLLSNALLQTTLCLHKRKTGAEEN